MRCQESEVSQHFICTRLISSGMEQRLCCGMQFMACRVPTSRPSKPNVTGHQSVVVVVPDCARCQNFIWYAFDTSPVTVPVTHSNDVAWLCRRAALLCGISSCTVTLQTNSSVVVRCIAADLQQKLCVVCLCWRLAQRLP